MGLLASLLGVSASGSTGTPAPGSDFWYGGGPRMQTAAGVMVTPDIAMQLSAVYACVTLLSKVVASLPLVMYERNRDAQHKEALGHPLYQVLQYQPNVWQTGFDFKAMMMSHLILRGNALAEIIPGARGAVDRLEPIHPDRVMQVERMPDRRLRFKIGPEFPGEPMRVLLQDEVFHIRAPNAPGLMGISPIAYARQTVGLALAAEEHGARMFSNGVRPTGIVTVPRTMSDKAFDRFKAEFRQAYQGLRNAGSVPILEDGAEFKAVNLTADDVQFLGTREFQTEEICRWFDVPPIMLHHAGATTAWGTGIEQIMLAFVRNNLKPWLEAWTQAITRDLIIAPERFYADWDVESLIRGDSKAMAEFYSRLVLNGILMRNEARAALGYDPKPGLDEPLTPTNTTTSTEQPGNGSQTPADGSAAALLEGTTE